jgi:hypothetical protein
MKARRGSRGISSTLYLTSALDYVGGQGHAPVILPRERSSTRCIEAGWTSQPVWTGMEKFSPHPTGIRSPDRPARSKSPDCAIPVQLVHTYLDVILGV